MESAEAKTERISGDEVREKEETDDRFENEDTNDDADKVDDRSSSPHIPLLFSNSNISTEELSIPPIIDEINVSFTPNDPALETSDTNIASFRDFEEPMSTQNLLANPEPPTVTLITLEDSVNTSPDVTFITETQTLENDAPSTTIALQLSPSQATQCDDKMDEFVPETPSKEDHSLIISQSIEMVCFEEGLLVNKSEDNVEEKDVDKSMVVIEPKSDDILNESNVENTKEAESAIDSDNVDKKTTLNMEGDGPKAAEGKAEVPVVEIIDDADSTMSISDNCIEPSIGNIDELIESIQILPSAPEKQDATDPQIELFKEDSNDSKKSSSIGSSRKAVIVLSQEDRKSAEIATKVLMDRKSSTPPIDSLSSSNSFNSPEAIDGCTLVNFREVSELISFDVKDGVVENVNQFITSAWTFSTQPSLAILNSDGKTDMDGYRVFAFQINTAEKEVNCITNILGFCEDYQSDKYLESSSANLRCYLKPVKIICSTKWKEQKYDLNTKQSFVENIGKGVSTTPPNVVWKGAIVNPISRIDAMKRKRKKRLLNTSYLIVGQRFKETWRFFFKDEKLEKVDRLFTEVTDSSGYVPDLSGSSSLSSSQPPSQSPKFKTPSRKNISGSSSYSSSNLSDPTSKNNSPSPAKRQPHKRNKLTSTALIGPHSSSTDSITSKISDIESFQPESQSTFIKSPRPSKSAKKFDWANTPYVKEEPADIELNSNVFAKYRDGNFYPAKVDAIDKDNHYTVTFLEDQITMLCTEENIVNVDRLPKGLSVMARSVKQLISLGIIENYYQSNVDKGYVVNCDGGLSVQFSVVDVFLTSSQARILEDDLHGLPRQPMDMSSPISADLDLANVVHCKRRAGKAAPSVTPKSSRKITRSRDINLASSHSSSTGNDAEENLSSKAKRKKDETYNEQEVPSGSKRKGHLALLSTKASPASKVRRGLSNMPSTSPVKNLFKGLAFLLSNTLPRPDTDDSDSSPIDSEDSNFNKSLLRSTIVNEGGQLISEFEGVKKIRKKCYLLAVNHLRTEKYIQCVASNVKCLTHKFIYDSINQCKLKPEADYILPTGYSILSNELYPWHGKRNILQKWNVMLYGKREFLDLWTNILSTCGGNAFRANIHSLDIENFVNIKVVISDFKCPKKLIDIAKLAEISVVTSEWLIQTVIHGYPVEFNDHPKFKVNF